MARRIPSPLAMRYYQLGTATIIFFIMTMVSTFGPPSLSFLTPFEALFGDGFLLLLLLYIIFEIHNYRTSRRMSYPVYSYDSRGIYRDGYLVADWMDITGVNVSFLTVKKHITMERVGETTSLFATSAPLDNLMLLSGKNELTARTRVARIIVSIKERRKRNSYVTIGTTTFKPMVRRTYRLMKRYAIGRSPEVAFSLRGMK